MTSHEKAKQYLDLERRMFEIFQGGQQRREMQEDGLLEHPVLCDCAACDATDKYLE